MKWTWLILLILILHLMTSSFSCIYYHRKVDVDSMHYFKPKQVQLMPEDYRDDVLHVRIASKGFVFTLDTTLHPKLFTAEKDAGEFYAIVGMIPEKITDTALVATLQYQSFGKADLQSTSRFIRLQHYVIPFSKLKSFSVYHKDYDKVFRKK